MGRSHRGKHITNRRSMYLTMILFALVFALVVLSFVYILHLRGAIDLQTFFRIREALGGTIEW